MDSNSSSLQNIHLADVSAVVFNKHMNVMERIV